MNLIAVDIGNSSIDIGFFTESGLIVQEIDTWPLKPHEEYLKLINMFMKEKNISKTPEGCIISSVVKGHNRVLKKALRELTSEEPLMVSHKVNTGIRFDIPHPERLGPDRIANVVAAYEFYRSSVAVVDLGTATTISILGNEANYIGGAIMPGLGLMNKSLSEGTSRLSEVTLSPPESALGIDTDGCIQSGLFFGTAGAIERLLDEAEKEAGIKLKVVVTGGYSSLISRFLRREHTLRPDLTIEGLRIIYMRNKEVRRYGD